MSTDSSAEHPNATTSDGPYRAMFEFLDDALALTDAAGTLLEANASFAELFGHTDVRNVAVSDYIHPNSRDRFLQFLSDPQMGGRSWFALAGLRRDGHQFEVEFRVRGVRSGSGAAVLLIARAVDGHATEVPIPGSRFQAGGRDSGRAREVAEILRDLLSSVNSKHSLDENLAAVADHARRVTAATASAIYLPDRFGATEVLRVSAASNLDRDYRRAAIPMGSQASGRAFVARRPVTIVDMGAAIGDPQTRPSTAEFEDRGSHLQLNRLPVSPVLIEGDDEAAQRIGLLGAYAAGYRALLAVPLAAVDHVRGTLTLLYDRPHEFGEDELGLALAIAEQAELALVAEDRLQTVEALYSADHMLHRSLRLEDVLDALAGIATEKLHAGGAIVWAWDSEQRQRVIRSAHGVDPEFLQRIPFMDHPPSMEGKDAASVLISHDVANDTRMPDPMRALLLAQGIGALISVALKVGDRFFGRFVVGHRQPRSFAPDEIKAIEVLAERAAVAVENARLHSQSEDRRKELEALFEADDALHRSLVLDDVLSALIEVAWTIYSPDAVVVCGLDPVTGSESIRASRGLLHPSEPIEGPLATDRSLTPVGGTAQQGSFAGQSSWKQSLRSREGFVAILSAPIRGHSSEFGSFTVAFRRPREFSRDEERIMQSLSHRVALAVDNAQLFEEAQEAASSRERQRLARELHDAVTQTLFSTALIADVLPEVWAADPRQGEERLQEVRRLTQGALAEMRSLLVELRPGSLGELALPTLLRQLAEAAQGRSRLDLRLQIDGDETNIPVDAKIALYRIAQEAINNIARHAKARNASLRLRYRKDGAVVLGISDDGRGFDSAAIPAGHMGVGIMRERAESIGAAFVLESTPGGGTTIEAVWGPPGGAG